jgi:hypothetical protein
MRKTPVAVKPIDGVTDPVSDGHQATRYREIVPNAQATELVDIGHYPRVQAPRKERGAYFAFLDSLSSPTAKRG